MSLYPGFADAVNYLHPGAISGGQVVLRDDGAGPYVAEWNLPGSPPTDAEVDAALAQIPAWRDAQNPDKTALRNAADTAISTNDAFLAIASPSNAQTLAQVKALTQQNTRIIKYLKQQL